MSPKAYSTKKHAWRDERVAAQYDARRFAGPLQRVKHGRDAALVRSLLQRAGRVRSVLDMPAGTGRLLPELHAAGRRVVGCDLSAEMLGVARERGGVALIQADGECLPFADDAFCAVVCMRFLFHVDDREARLRLLGEMARVAARWVVGEVRLSATLKQVSRRARHRVGLFPRPRPAQDRGEVSAELARAGLELVDLRPISRLFSDKALFLARPSR